MTDLTRWASVVTDRCLHGRNVAEILNVPMEPIDAYMRQCVCCLNVFPTRTATTAFCPECRRTPAIVLPNQGV